MTLALLRLAVPAVAHMLLLTAVFFVDRLLLGRVSQGALASLQLSAILVWTIYAVFTAFSAGTLAIVARSIGEGDRLRADDALTASVGLSLVIGTVVSAALWIAKPVLVASLFPGAEPSVVADSHAYLDIVVPTLPFMFAEAILAAGLQGAGDTRSPLGAALFGNLTNLIVAPVLVFGLLGAPALGVRGAAIGCALTNVIQAVLLARSVLARDAVVSPSLPSPRRLAAALRRVLRVSGPAFVEKSLYHAGYLAFVGIIALLGTAAMAANQALISIEAVAFLTADGLGIAAAALVGQKLGQGRLREAKHVGYVAALIACVALSLLAIAFLLWPRGLVSVFVPGESIATSALIVAAIAQPFMAIATALRMSLRGAGATREVLFITFVGTFLVRLPATYLFAILLDGGLTGVWLGSTADWIVQAALALHVFRRGAWQRRTL